MSTPTNRPALAIQLRGGVSICVPPSLRVTTTYVLLEQEDWFEDEVDFVRAYLRTSECAVDVGASFGVYTTAMGEAVGPTGKVFSFEPGAETTAYLRASVELRHGAQVEVIQAAVSDHLGQAQFQVGRTPELGGLANAKADAGVRETVQLTTLDEYLVHPNGRRVALIKLDAEGHELQVGFGARKLMIRDEPLVLFEIKQGKAFDFGFLDFIESLGWAGYRLVPGLQILVPFNREGPIDGYLLNLFGCSKGKADELEQRGLLVREPENPLSLPVSAAPALPFTFATQPAAGTPYDLALAHFGQSQQPDLPAQQRMGHLARAWLEGGRALAERPSLARSVTLARIAADLGYRSSASGTLHRAITSLTRAPFESPDEPCLVPPRCADEFKEDASPERWQIAILEAFERLRAFSSLFWGRRALPLLETICSHPLSSPEMHRRRQLLRMHSGLQSRPEAEPKLVQESAANLNAWFWRG